MSKPHSKPRTEHASDLWTGAALEEHYTMPWAMVGRVECEATHGDGEPVGEPGEIIVRQVNAAAHSVPEAMIGTPPISVAIGYPFVPMSERAAQSQTLGGAMLEPNTARALARYLWEAADRADPPSSEMRQCVECGDMVGDVHNDGRNMLGKMLYQARCECGVAGPACLTRAGAIARWNGMMMVTP